MRLSVEFGMFLLRRSYEFQLRRAIAAISAATESGEAATGQPSCHAQRIFAAADSSTVAFLQQWHSLKACVVQREVLPPPHVEAKDVGSPNDSANASPRDL
jgi:hypothetical protein